MPLVKTWCHAYPSRWEAHPWYDEAWRTHMWQLKEALVNAAVGAWTVVASGNRSVAGLYDTWTTWANVDGRNSDDNTYVSPGSWMLLKSPTGARGPFWLLFEISSTSFTTNTPTRFWVTKTEPDLSNLVDYRLPPLTGPYAFVSATLDAGGADNHVDVLVADDGSFCMTTRKFPTDQGGIGHPRTFLFFNIMDDVPPQDPYGFVLFAVGNQSASLEQQSGGVWTSGVGIDPDGVASNRSFVCTNPWTTSGYMNSDTTAAKIFAEDPAWGKYYSEKIPIFCTTAGRRGIRGTLSDIWWAPFNVTTGVCGHIDTSTKVCCMQCFWLPCPGDPWIL